jgi:hypothetical protein
MLKMTIAKVKPEEEQNLRAWLAQLNSRRDEVRETFSREGVRHEQAYLLRTSDAPILIYVMEAQDHELARKAFQSSTLPIDLEHKAVMSRVLAGKADVELLYECATDSDVR